MFAGHLGAGLGLGAFAPRKNPATLVLAASAPPSGAAAAVGALGGIAVTVGLVAWIARPAR